MIWSPYPMNSALRRQAGVAGAGHIDGDVQSDVAGEGENTSTRSANSTASFSRA